MSLCNHPVSGVYVPLQMLEQLNHTLEEEKRTLLVQLNKLLGQNQELLMKTLESKEIAFEDERLFKYIIILYCFYKLERSVVALFPSFPSDCKPALLPACLEPLPQVASNSILEHIYFLLSKKAISVPQLVYVKYTFEVQIFHCSDRLGELQRDKARLSEKLVAQQREHLHREMDILKNKNKSKNILKKGFRKLKGKLQVCLHPLRRVL